MTLFFLSFSIQYSLFRDLPILIGISNHKDLEKCPIYEIVQTIFPLFIYSREHTTCSTIPLEKKYRHSLPEVNGLINAVWQNNCGRKVDHSAKKRAFAARGGLEQRTLSQWEKTASGETFSSRFIRAQRPRYNNSRARRPRGWPGASFLTFVSAGGGRRVSRNKRRDRVRARMKKGLSILVPARDGQALKVSGFFSQSAGFRGCSSFSRKWVPYFAEGIWEGVDYFPCWFVDVKGVVTKAWK